jgi:hypothetical protein
MSDGKYFASPRTVVLDNGQTYKIVYGDGKFLSTTSPERIYWLRLELLHLVSFSQFWICLHAFYIPFKIFIFQIFRVSPVHAIIPLFSQFLSTGFLSFFVTKIHFF